MKRYLRGLAAILVLLVSMPADATRFTVKEIRDTFNGDGDFQLVVFAYIGGLTDMYLVTEFEMISESQYDRDILNECTGRFTPRQLTFAVLGTTYSEDIDAATIVTRTIIANKACSKYRVAAGEIDSGAN